MHLSDDIHSCSHRNADGYLKSFPVNGEGRGIINLIGACRFIVNAVGDLLPGSELHERSAVIDPHLTESWPHMTNHLRVKIIVIMVNTGRTTAKELALRPQLLMHLEARFEADPLIIIKRCLLTGDIPDLLPRFFVVSPRINY